MMENKDFKTVGKSNQLRVSDAHTSGKDVLILYVGL
jgi:hypothetical protein